MLVAVTVCVALSWYSSRTRQMLRQQHAVEQIRKLGGHATYAHQIEGNPPPMPPPYLRRITGDVVMSNAVKVSWHAVHASDDDIVALADLSKLNDLRLNSTRLSDDAIEPLSQLTELRRLDLWCSGVTDRSMPHLSKLHQLRRLSLYSTQVTDEGLKFLGGLRNLKELNLRDTNVTRAGVEWLQDKLPDCKISG